MFRSRMYMVWKCTTDMPAFGHSRSSGRRETYGTYSVSLVLESPLSAASSRGQSGATWDYNLLDILPLEEAVRHTQPSGKSEPRSNIHVRISEVYGVVPIGVHDESILRVNKPYRQVKSVV